MGFSMCCPSNAFAARSDNRLMQCFHYTGEGHGHAAPHRGRSDVIKPAFESICCQRLALLARTTAFRVRSQNTWCLLSDLGCAHRVTPGVLAPQGSLRPSVCGLRGMGLRLYAIACGSVRKDRARGRTSEQRRDGLARVNHNGNHGPCIATISSPVLGAFRHRSTVPPAGGPRRVGPPSQSNDGASIPR
jgi:hypothetical protein